MPVALEDFDAELDSTTLALLGDTIIYTPSAGVPLTFRAIVDYGDDIERLSGTGVVRGECAVEVPVATIAQPSGADLIDLPKRAGERFLPKDWKLNKAGDGWLILLKRKPD